jgi:hypothetical protein
MDIILIEAIVDLRDITVIKITMDTTAINVIKVATDVTVIKSIGTGKEGVYEVYIGVALKLGKYPLCSGPTMQAPSLTNLLIVEPEQR